MKNDLNKLGTFKATKDGLVEIPDKPIIYHHLGKDYLVKPDDPLYGVIKSYDKNYDCVDSEL